MPADVKTTEVYRHMLARLQSLRSRVFLGAVLAVCLAHIMVLALVRAAAPLSNMLQLLSVVLSAGLCFYRAWQTPRGYLKEAWAQLGAAFSLWAAGQCYFLVMLLRLEHAPQFPSPADFLWLLFAFPLLMVTVRRPRPSVKWEWVNWLDTAQAATFFFVLYGLVFLRGNGLSPVSAYDVQSAGLLLAGALRYSTTSRGPERAFFRNVGGFLILYAVLTSLGNRLNEVGIVSGSWADLCWSLPFTFFSILTLTNRPADNIALRHEKQRAVLPSHLHGLSALGLSAMTFAAAVALHASRPVLGVLGMGFSLLLFAIRTSARESQLHLAHDTLRHSARHDALTGLANRACLRSELAHCLGEESAPGTQVGLLFIDLDRFKTINDGLGHAFGDRLLKEIASVLSATVRPHDLVVRLGGDEFVVMMENIQAREARSQANLLVERLRQPLTLEGRVVHLTASVGVVLGQAGMHPDDLLRDADCAMYVAKNAGKNQARVFELSMATKARDDLSLETDLRQTISAHGLTPHYQPIYSLSRKAVVGFEALSRWQHPTRGAILPAEFIPLAEETGLIIELGKQVLHEACRQVQHWNEVYDRQFTVSVNVSARQFADPELFRTIKTILAETGLPPTLLHLEITESVLLGGLTATEAVLNQARMLGIEISLDDFGTGYSSLSYLLRFPFDVVKIDRSFVHAIDLNPRQAELVQTVIQLARNLNKKVIAEGVETEAEQKKLEEFGCDLLQGFLYSPPLPAHLVEQRLRGEQADRARGLLWSPGKPMESIAAVERPSIARPGSRPDQPSRVATW